MAPLGEAEKATLRAALKGELRRVKRMYEYE